MAPMDVEQRARSERLFHDRQALERATFLRGAPGQLLFAETSYLDHEPWIRPALASFGEVRGRRVLDFGCGHGMAAFCEPWGGNPFLSWARRHLPYHGKTRTPDELPLIETDVDCLRQVFARVEATGSQLFSMLGRLAGHGRCFRVLARWDERLLA